MKRIGIFGASECGKTTLAKAMSREFWRRQKKPSLVFALFPENWGGHAWVTTDQEKFMAAVAKKKNCLVIIEDASGTVNRDKDFKKHFTAIRHGPHDLIVIGHNGTDLLPVMREQLNELYFFLINSKAVELWQITHPDMKGLEQAADLKQYEFIQCRKFSTAQKMKLKL